MSTITAIQEIQKMSLISVSGRNISLPDLITSTSMEIMNVYVPIGMSLACTYVTIASVFYLKKMITSLLS